MVILHRYVLGGEKTVLKNLNLFGSNNLNKSLLGEFVKIRVLRRPV